MPDYLSLKIRRGLKYQAFTFQRYLISFHLLFKISWYKADPQTEPKETQLYPKWTPKWTTIGLNSGPGGTPKSGSFDPNQPKTCFKQFKILVKTKVLLFIDLDKNRKYILALKVKYLQLVKGQWQTYPEGRPNFWPRGFNPILPDQQIWFIPNLDPF